MLKSQTSCEAGTESHGSHADSRVAKWVSGFLMFQGYRSGNLQCEERDLMNASPNGWRVAVFRRCNGTDTGQLVLDLNMTKVLRQLDGHKNLASVAFAAGLTMSELQNAIRSLLDLELIEPIALGHDMWIAESLPCR